MTVNTLIKQLLNFPMDTEVVVSVGIPNGNDFVFGNMEFISDYEDGSIGLVGFTEVSEEKFVCGKYEIRKRIDGYHIETNDGWCYHEAIDKLWNKAPIFKDLEEAKKWFVENKEDLL